ncbi:hypothetical protein AT727_12130 [Desulfitobacterium hafniense]|uniref:Fibronectin type-III domain-containing protein n=1 Tax=Desulfitobacterium hafniense TaxID=49338 RepID=A0A0W1JCS3_DESHA|nr:fibronectin type III domain-containing protein [Desulfitobacterium hafniense]KTE89575.1 hypothetical protein AT727_12130 [Desulfitobacterium hafniense]
MMKEFLSRKKTQIFSVLMVAVLMIASFVPSAFALNYNGTGSGTGNKSLDFNGYEYTKTGGTATLNLYFNKSLASSQVTGGQFQVKLHNSPYTPASFTYTNLQVGNNASGVTDSGLTNGSTVTLSFASALADDTLYDVVINAGTLADAQGAGGGGSGSGPGKTLGNYTDRADFTFTFRTPDSLGGYSNVAPVVTFFGGPAAGTDWSYESNLGVVFDRPIDSSSLSTFLSALSSNYVRTDLMGSPAVVQDPTINGSATANAECYTPHANAAQNTFFFPETVNGNTNPVYNRADDASHSYSLTLPSFTDVSSNTFSTPGSLSFTTLSDDLPGWLDNIPTVVAGATPGDLDVSWDYSAIDPFTDTFDVYIADSTVYADPLTATYSLADSGVIGDSTTLTGLVSNRTYYVRVVPINAVGSVGFSWAGSGTAK